MQDDVIGPEEAFTLAALGSRPLRTLTRPRLPTPATPLFGREREVAELRALLRRPDVRAVTLTGAGGTGKTRLALAVAADTSDEYREGAVFVPLASLRDPGLVAGAVADVLGLREAGDVPVARQVCAGLEEQEIIVVLDNFEQLLDAAPFVAELLAAAPRMQLIITSRARLRISGEHEYAVDPLELPGLQATSPAIARCPAVELFVHRAEAAGGEFELTDANATTVAEICRRLDGLPLALELAAARVKLMGLSALLGRLERRLALLTSGGRDQPEHKQTLRGTIAWSYELLSSEEQRLFERLGVFRGGFRLEAAETVGSAEQESTDVLEPLASLLDKSLLRRVADSPRRGNRFAMLETIREYAIEKLLARDDANDVRRRHAEHYLAVAERAEADFLTGAQLAGLRHFDEEVDNFRVALEWSRRHDEPAILLGLSAALVRFWLTRGHLDEGRRWLETALATDAGKSSPVTRARALVGLAHLTGPRDPTATASYAERARTIFAELGNKVGEARATNSLAVLAQEANDNAQAQRLHERTLELYREAGDERGAAISTGNMGYLALTRGDYTRAIALLEQSLATARRVGDLDFESAVLHNLGLAAALQGRAHASARLLREALATAHGVGSRVTSAYCLEALAAIAAAAQPVRAARLLGAGDTLLETTGMTREPAEARLRSDVLADLRDHLGADRLGAEIAAGGQLTLDDAVALALESA